MYALTYTKILSFHFYYISIKMDPEQEFITDLFDDGHNVNDQNAPLIPVLYMSLSADI